MPQRIKGGGNQAVEEFSLSNSRTGTWFFWAARRTLSLDDFRRAARSYQAARHLEANARGDDARRAQALRVAAVRAAQLVEAARRELEGRLAAKVGGDGDAADPIRAFTTFEVRDALAAPGCSLDESQRAAVLKTALDYGWLASTAVSGAVDASQP